MGILIGVMGIILAFLTYIAGVQRVERRFAEDRRRETEDRIVETVLRTPPHQRDINVSALISGGILEVQSDKEVMRVVRRIEQRGFRPGLPPLVVERVPKGCLLGFLRWCSEQRTGLQDFMNSKRMNETIDRYLADQS
jgi:hypothetical protein